MHQSTGHQSTGSSARKNHDEIVEDDLVLDLETADLVARLLREDPRTGSAPLSVHMLTPGSPFVPLATQVEADVFAGHFDFTREGVLAHYAPYDPTSTFVLMVDRIKLKPVGVARLVMMGDAGLPTFNDMAEVAHWSVGLTEALDFHDWPESLDDFCDLATLAVRREYRLDGLASAALYHASYWHCRAAGVTRWVAMLEEVVYQAHCAMGMPWERICGLPSGPCAGSEKTSPVAVAFSQVADCIRECSPAHAELLIDGKGLDAAASLPKVAVLSQSR